MRRMVKASPVNTKILVAEKPVRVLIRKPVDLKRQSVEIEEMDLNLIFALKSCLRLDFALESELRILVFLFLACNISFLPSIIEQQACPQQRPGHLPWRR